MSEPRVIKKSELLGAPYGPRTEEDYKGLCSRCGRPIYELSGDPYAHVGCYFYHE